MSELRSDTLNNSDSLISSKQEEIDNVTRNAYLYATGMIVVVVIVTFMHVWTFYFGQNMGMQMRIITTGAIYDKVCKCSVAYVLSEKFYLRY